MELEAGPKDKFPEVVNVLIEIPKGSRVKYEWEKKQGILKVDRILYTSMVYPFNYGFIPKTLCEDGDPLDCLVLMETPLQAGCLIEVKPIGILKMEDEKGMDEKLIAVPLEKIEPRVSNLKDIKDLPEAIKEEIRHFFEHYKELEPGKWVKIKEWLGKEEALEFLKKVVR